MAIEKWLAVVSLGLFAMFSGEMISIYNYVIVPPENAIIDDSWFDSKIFQFISIGVAPAGILAAVAYIMSRNYGSKQIGGLIIVGGIILLAGNLVVYSMVDSIRDSYVTDAVQYLPILFIILSAPVMAVGARLILKRKKRPTKEYF